MMRRPISHWGFTLIEAIIVIAITGVIAAMVSIFIVSPVTGYVASVHHAQLTDAADVTLRRLQREIRLALPNSVRVTDNLGDKNTCAPTASTCYIEYIPTVSGALYRSPGDGSTQGNFFEANNPNNATVAVFDVLGSSDSLSYLTKGSYVVIDNQGSAPQDAYQLGNCPNCNIASIGLINGNTVTLTSFPLTAASPNNRFQVVPSSGPVTYSCSQASTAGATGAAFTRYINYGFQATQPTPPTGATTQLVVSNAACYVDYALGSMSTDAILFVQINVIDPTSCSGGATPVCDTVTVFREIHVDNAP
jgi:MSHA biogenesis protein MshO